MQDALFAHPVGEAVASATRQVLARLWFRIGGDERVPGLLAADCARDDPTALGLTGQAWFRQNAFDKALECWDRAREQGADLRGLEHELARARKLAVIRRD